MTDQSPHQVMCHGCVSRAQIGQFPQLRTADTAVAHL